MCDLKYPEAMSGQLDNPPRRSFPRDVQFAVQFRRFYIYTAWAAVPLHADMQVGKLKALFPITIHVSVPLRRH
jgi:hypothetical protein